jgi:hypothetical protein
MEAAMIIYQDIKDASELGTGSSAKVFKFNH